MSAFIFPSINGLTPLTQYLCVLLSVGNASSTIYFFLSIYLAGVDLNRESPVTSTRAVHLHMSENINMKCYVGPAAARQDPTPSDKMQLSASFTSVRSQGTCTLFYWKGLNALINSAAFFCNFTQQLMRRTGKIHRRSLNITFWWFSKLNSFNVLTILRFRWTASVCCVLLSIGFWHRCRLFSPHLSDEYFLDSMLGNSSPLISIKKKKTIFLHSAWRELHIIYSELIYLL